MSKGLLGIEELPRSDIEQLLNRAGISSRMGMVATRG